MDLSAAAGPRARTAAVAKRSAAHPGAVPAIEWCAGIIGVVAALSRFAWSRARQSIRPGRDRPPGGSGAWRVAGEAMGRRSGRPSAGQPRVHARGPLGTAVPRLRCLVLLAIGGGPSNLAGFCCCAALHSEGNRGLLECGLVKSSSKRGSAIARINCDTARLIYTVLANGIISQCSIASTGLEINPNSGVASRLRIATNPRLVRLEGDRHRVCPNLTHLYKITLAIEVNRPRAAHRSELVWTAR
jgi:hypothetical protein